MAEEFKSNQRNYKFGQVVKRQGKRKPEIVQGHDFSSAID